uniref:RING-type domain-containing protein n=1 Tax=Solanum lycopersicum TaxID=4081 RepID=A0A3Q7J3D3_SOLLC
MKNIGKEFEDNYRSDIIRYIIGEVRDVFDDESNKGREKVEVSVDTVFTVKRFLDKSILDDDCVICFEKPGKEREVMCTPCSHMFHEDCIVKWLEHDNSCPICRQDILDS